MAEALGLPGNSVDGCRGLQPSSREMSNVDSAEKP
jgi:hypothetical protein